jgi:N-methylhydantoinase A
VCEQARETLRSEGVPDSEVQLQAAADLRYLGQEYTLTVPMALTPSAGSLAALAEQFHADYLERYGHHNPGEIIEMVNVRVVALGLRERPKERVLPERPAPEPIGTTQTVFTGEAITVPVYDRETLGRGTRLAGPAIVLESGCTTLIPPGWRLETADAGHLILEREA